MIFDQYTDSWIFSSEHQNSWTELLLEALIFNVILPPLSYCSRFCRNHQNCWRKLYLKSFICNGSFPSLSCSGTFCWNHENRETELCWEMFSSIWALYVFLIVENSLFVVWIVEYYICLKSSFCMWFRFICAIVVHSVEIIKIVEQNSA